ncbi:hypothetical protein ON010_g9988 [Phytophthora cinnamomi]|nr:hypothetical protein ON010_g9988 [Phytophthora cinnamomi]
MVDLMTSEDFKALEAALAFFDDCDDGFSSDLSSDDKADADNSRPSPSSATQTSANAKEIARIKTKLAMPGRNRSRDLQKLEILQLREEAAALQVQLDELLSLKVIQHEGESHQMQFGLTRSAETMLHDAWKRLANRQKRLRRQAEEENDSLRHLHATQMKTIKKNSRERFRGRQQ